MAKQKTMTVILIVITVISVYTAIHAVTALNATRSMLRVTEILNDSGTELIEILDYPELMKDWVKLNNNYPYPTIRDGYIKYAVEFVLFPVDYISYTLEVDKMFSEEGLKKYIKDKE